jgi:hypothetical protein
MTISDELASALATPSATCNNTIQINCQKQITTQHLATLLVGLLGRCLFGPADADCRLSIAMTKIPTPPHVMINSTIQQSAILLPNEILTKRYLQPRVRALLLLRCF